MPVLMLMLITLLNDGTLISIGYDYVTPSKYPNEWNLPVLFTVSSVLAAVALFSSLLLLYWSLVSWDEESLFNRIGIGGLTYGQITSTIYLKVSISDFLTLFSARTHEGFFWSSRPSNILLGAGCLALTISTILACSWPDVVIDDTEVIGLSRRYPEAMALYVWLYCIFWWLLQDGAKVFTYYILNKFNLFNIKTLLNKEKIEDDDEDRQANSDEQESGKLLKEKLLA